MFRPPNSVSPVTSPYEVESTSTGATGAVMNLYHDKDNPDVFDGSIINFDGNSSTGNRVTYAAMKGIVVDNTDGAEIGGYLLQAAQGGSLQSLMAIFYDGTDTTFGSSIAGANMVFATDTNGNITMSPNGTGIFKGLGNAPAVDTLIQAPEQVFIYEFNAASFDANDDIIIFNANSPQMTITTVEAIIDTLEGGALTGTLRSAASGGGNAISSALDFNSGSLERTTTLANYEIAASSSLVLHASANPTTVEGKLLIRAVMHS